MNRKLLDLSNKIEQELVPLYEAVSTAAARLGIPFFIVGATARDIILSLAHDIPITRLTKDVDVGVRVATWEEFRTLPDELVNKHDFKATSLPQRLSFRGRLVDLVPFGPLAAEGEEIRFPPDEGTVMSTVGFAEAYEASQIVRLRSDPPLDVRFASLAGLTVLKLMAWADRPAERQKDAIDLKKILSNYLDAGNYERVVQDHEDLLMDDEFDYERASARLLGRDIGDSFSSGTRERLLEVLAAESEPEGKLQLVRGMVDRAATAEETHEDQLDKNLLLLKALKQGVEERT
jgi:predicted nucleotidyltransferase